MKYPDYCPAGASFATSQQRELVHESFDATVPDVWREIAELNFSALRRSVFFEKYPDEMLAVMAVELVYELVACFGGNTMYLPNGWQKMKNIKNALIARDFKGNNIRELAKKYGLSDMRVRQILEEQTALSKQASPVQDR